MDQITAIGPGMYRATYYLNNRRVCDKLKIKVDKIFEEER